MRITRYSRSSGRGAYYYRAPTNPYRRRGGPPYDGPPSARGFNNSQSQPPFSVRHGHGDRRTRLISPDDRLAYRERMMRMVRDTLDRRSRSRERYRDDLRRTSRSRDRSLSSVLSDISSGSSCFGAVRASEAYGSPVYEDLTEDEIQSLELEDEEEDEDGEEQTSSSAEMVVAPPMVRHKKRKKDKKKKEKVKERERKRAKKERRRQKEILEERICPPEHEVAQSKEIFASGQNILVSVSFIDSEKTSEREKYKKNKHRKKLRRQKLRGKLTVAKEEKLPKADRGSSQGSADGASVPADEKNNVPQGKLQEPQHSSLEHHQQQQQSIIQPPPAKKKKLDPAVKPVMVIDLERSPSGQVISSPREVIVLSDEEGKRARGTEEATKPNDIDLNNRGPNTPPEPAPKSPDSYDPFQPTKSSPRSGISTNDIGSISTISFQEPRHLHLDEQKDEVKAEFHHPHHHLHPHSHHHHHHHHHHGQHHHGHPAQERLLAPTEHTSGSGGFNDDSILDLHPESPFDKLDVNSPRTVVTSAHHFHQSPMKAIIKSMPKKLLAAGNSRDSRPHSAAIKSNQTGTGTGGGTMAATSGGVPFEDELNDGDISPYSPRSSDCDAQLFEPPQDGNGETQTIALTVDNLRRVFGNDPKTLYGDLRKSYQHRSVIAVDEMYKPHKMTLEMLDEIPDSAVDMQVKEKLIKKLQRQERIVEEVKHFLKPHFNKKRIDKDEYKEIMRKSIPKICHSRSGEINPAKIQALITAYVKKAIAKRKLLGIEIGSSSGTPLANISYVPSTTAAPTIPPLSASEPAPSVVLMNR